MVVPFFKGGVSLFQGLCLNPFSKVLYQEFREKNLGRKFETLSFKKGLQSTQTTHQTNTSHNKFCFVRYFSHCPKTEKMSIQLAAVQLIANLWEKGQSNNKVQLLKGQCFFSWYKEFCCAISSVRSIFVLANWVLIDSSFSKLAENMK